MNYLYSPIFREARLDAMKRGEVRLGVPLLGNVIQIGAVDETTKGHILVKKGLRSITVRRDNGESLQAEVITTLAGDDLDGTGPLYERASVFIEPVDKVVFRPRRDTFGERCWQATGDNLGAGGLHTIERFAQVVGTFTLAKQGLSITSSTVQ